MIKPFKPVHLDPNSSPIPIYVTIVAATVATLLGEPQMLFDGRWQLFVLAMIFFTLFSLGAGYIQHTRWHPAFLIAAAVTALTLEPITNNFLLTPIITFITVSQAQTIFSPRNANLFGVALTLGIVFSLKISGDWLTAIQSGIGYAAGYVFIVIFTRIAIREREAREELQTLYQQLERTKDELAEYSTQVAKLATLRERNRLARDVHDSLGHYLTVINVQLEVVNKLIDSDLDRAKEAATRAKQLASEGLAEVRRSVAALRPTPLDERPLPDAIRHLIDNARQDGLVITFNQHSNSKPLSPESEIVLYRAAQEALTNIRKHARASIVSIRLAYDTNSTCLTVRDNGVGRDASSPDHVGLLGLRERTESLNGILRAENHTEGGFIIEVVLPNEQ
jgi:signal transduction histidine kinase